MGGGLKMLPGGHQTATPPVLVNKVHEDGFVFFYDGNVGGWGGGGWLCGKGQGGITFTWRTFVGCAGRGCISLSF